MYCVLRLVSIIFHSRGVGSEYAVEEIELPSDGTGPVWRIVSAGHYEILVRNLAGVHGRVKSAVDGIEEVVGTAVEHDVEAPGSQRVDSGGHGVASPEFRIVVARAKQ